MKQRIAHSRSYTLTKYITNVMDRFFLDPLLGLVPGLDSFVGIFCTGVFVYVSLTKVRSVALTLAIIYNFLADTVISLIPFVGNVLDIFNRSYMRSQTLIDGYANDDKEIIKKVNRQASKMVILSLLFILLIAFLIWLVYIAGAWMFTAGGALLESLIH